MADIDYYVSLNSPWTYLGSGRIEAIAARHGATLRIWPVDFSIIFPASGGLPLPKRSPQRQAYRMQELARWREHLGSPLTAHPAPGGLSVLGTTGRACRHRAARGRR